MITPATRYPNTGGSLNWRNNSKAPPATAIIVAKSRTRPSLLPTAAPTAAIT